MPGWIKLYRTLLTHKHWEKERKSDTGLTKGMAWIELLLLATHKLHTKEIHGIEVTYKPGDVVATVAGLSHRWGWSRSKVQRFLDTLENEHQIEQQKTSVSTLISITNWQLYQQNEQQNEQQTNSKRTANEHIQEGKEGKEDIPKEKKEKSRQKNLEQVIGYFLDKGYNQLEAEKFYNHYVAVGWVYGRTKLEVKDWRGAARSWMNKSDEIKKEKDERSTTNTGRKQSHSDFIENC